MSLATEPHREAAPSAADAPTDAAPLLDARELTVRFGAFVAVERLSLSVGRGEIAGLIGPNGAGKSTAFAALSGFEPAGGGEIRFDGEDITARPPAWRARAGLGRTFQVPREFEHLGVRENLLAASPEQPGNSLLRVLFSPATVRRHEAALIERADRVLEFLNLDRVADESAGRLSGGQKKLLELGRLLMGEPKLLLLDEPFAGVNPVLIEEIGERIVDLAARGISVLVVEHNLEVLSRLASRLFVMDRGVLLASGSPRDVLADPLVRGAYMGGVA